MLFASVLRVLCQNHVYSNHVFTWPGMSTYGITHGSFPIGFISNRAHFQLGSILIAFIPNDLPKHKRQAVKQHLDDRVGAELETSRAYRSECHVLVTVRALAGRDITHIYIYIYICIYTIYIYIYRERERDTTYIYIYIYVYPYVHIPTWIDIQHYMYLSLSIYIYIYICVQRERYIHTQAVKLNKLAEPWAPRRTSAASLAGGLEGSLHDIYIYI